MLRIAIFYILSDTISCNPSFNYFANVMQEIMNWKPYKTRQTGNQQRTGQMVSRKLQAQIGGKRQWIL